MGDNSNVNMKQDHEEEYLKGLPYMYAHTYINTYIHTSRAGECQSH